MVFLFYPSIFFLSFLFCILFVLSKELFFFDEEFLVVFCFIIIFFFLVRNLSGVISSELLARQNTLFSQFSYFFLLKSIVINLVIDFFTLRKLYLFQFFKFFLSSFFLFYYYIIFRIDFLNFFFQKNLINRLNKIISFENNFIKKNVMISFILTEDKNFFFSEFSNFFLLNLK